MPYEIIGHTADIRLKVWGSSPQELFLDALLGMTRILKSKIPKSEREAKGEGRKIEIASPDQTALLVDFLNEALLQANINKEVYNEAQFKSLSKKKLEADLSGIPVQEFDEDIKAVTYHEAEIKKRPDGQLETTLIFDI